MAMQTCCICHQLFEGYGNNPAPYKTEGTCCDDCNLNFVIPARMSDIHKQIHSNPQIRPYA